ncbi:TetR family transcriptional regulator [Mycobacterium tuberculosis]|nr:TetR family transcriptional regulator [Mycobacterium tuberculosis]
MYACVESYAPALRSEALRERLAAGYADVRQHSVDLAGAALAGTDIAPPENLSTIVSVLMAVIDGPPGRRARAMSQRLARGSGQK